MVFGNWIITDEGIKWNGTGMQRFEIPATELNATSIDTSGNAIYYNWIRLATDEDWLTQNDLYDLNYAFVYAAARFNVDFIYEIFDATLEQQYEQFDAEEDEDADL